MYFADLDPCTYHRGHLDADSWAVPLRAVGWLEHPHEFAVGAVPAGVVSRLEELATLIHQSFRHYEFRGAYECSLCHAVGRRTGGAGWSQENLIIPGRGEVFAAPGGVIHYIVEHSYLPPARFLEAVGSCPDPVPGEYIEALRRANGGTAPPVETYEESLARSRAIMARHQALRDAMGIWGRGTTRAQVIEAARAIWPALSCSDDAEFIELDDVRILFDSLGRLVDIVPKDS